MTMRLFNLISACASAVAVMIFIVAWINQPERIWLFATSIVYAVFLGAVQLYWFLNPIQEDDNGSE